jgi:hypothetical protein
MPKSGTSTLQLRTQLNSQLEPGRSSQHSRTQVKLVRMAGPAYVRYNEARSSTDHLKAQGCSLTQRMSQLKQGLWSPALPRTGAVPGQTKATDASSPHP